MTVNILNDHCSPLTSGTNLQSINSLTNRFTFHDTDREGGGDMVGETVLVYTIFNITQSSKLTLDIIIM